ncbi:helix-turn-helix transcriptional regulator [Thermoactinospora rubra]|uniref:helix-turn-helix transcriptional regulator n=1 Tax=Thermoactinospora rubra TaxID=1088767 RepID=UPI000A1052E5|nr:helix-turn-helix transcriptional regulator [Thermoactinospora rubra]
MEADALQQALGRLRRATGVPVVFGGAVSARRQIRLTEMRGTRTTALRNLAISAGRGLGGKVVALARPAAVGDYASACDISHEYDRPVRAEALRSVLAVPVVVDRVVRAVLYAALRQPLAFGDRTLGVAARVGADLATELAVRDEVERRLARAGQHERREDIREAHAELRAIAQEVADPALRERLLAVCERLGGPPRAQPAVRLSPRELDVLAWIALGCTNAETAQRLGLLPETVKSYLRSAMRKLGTHNRHETVVAARRTGLLP